MNAGVEGLLGPELGRDVLVTRTGGVFGKWMAGYAVGWCAWVVQRMEQQREAQRRREWRTVLPESLHSKTLTIVGFGDIGAAIGRAAKAVGMRVVGISRSGSRRSGANVVWPMRELSRGMAEADFVAVVLPLTEETRGLIGAAELRIMKPSSWLLHMGRGPVVDETALVRSLGERQIAGAILDVFCEEPLPRESPLWQLENVVITPHVAGRSVPSEVVPVFNSNLRRYVSGRELQFVVNRAVGY